MLWMSTVVFVQAQYRLFVSVRSIKELRAGYLPGADNTQMRCCVAHGVVYPLHYDSVLRVPSWVQRFWGLHALV